MPRRNSDKRTPYEKATGRRVTRGLELVAKMKAEMYSVEQALSSGRYLYTTNLGEMAARLQATMGELEALEEMHEDAEAVAALARIPDPDLTDGQTTVLSRLAETAPGVYSVHAPEWIWISPGTTVEMLTELAGLGLAKEVVPDGSNARYFEITQLGREIAGRI